MDRRGYVLAGGRSRRFGRDKSQVVIDDRRALDRQIAVVAAVCAGHVTVIGDPQRLAVEDGPVLADRHGSQGPLDGVLTALHHAGESNLALVVAVDLWNLSESDLGRLVDVFGPSPADIETDVAHLRSDVDVQPLAALWRVRTCLPALQAEFDGGQRSIVRAWGRLRRTPVQVPTTTLVNVNTEHDFALWQATRNSTDGADGPPGGNS